MLGCRSKLIMNVAIKNYKIYIFIILVRRKMLSVSPANNILIIQAIRPSVKVEFSLSH